MYPKLSCSLFVLCGVASSLTWAADEPVTTLEAITVTGEKIERDLQETTTSIAVIDGELLAEKQLDSVKAAYRFAANVRDSDWVDSGFIIRGINSEGIGGPSGSPLSTMYIDNIAQTSEGARRGALGVWDMEQIDLFRGPQSTTGHARYVTGLLVA